MFSFSLIKNECLNLIYNKGLSRHLPHIKLNNTNRYLIVLIDISKPKKILWCAVFAYNTKQKTILSYIAPFPSYDEKQHKYIIKVYTYPDNIPQYTVIYMSKLVNLLDGF